jgi:hypothetical protein
VEDQSTLRGNEAAAKVSMPITLVVANVGFQGSDSDIVGAR